jgi:hypothetical protein
LSINAGNDTGSGGSLVDDALVDGAGLDGAGLDDEGGFDAEPLAVAVPGAAAPLPSSLPDVQAVVASSPATAAQIAMRWVSRMTTILTARTPFRDGAAGGCCNADALAGRLVGGQVRRREAREQRVT